jgi:choline kinase
LSETELKPKCLSLVFGKPLIEWQLEALRQGGIDEIAIVSGYKSELIQNYTPFNFSNLLWESTNMVRSLLSAREWLTEYECIVSYSDIYYEKEAISSLSDSINSISITYDPNWIKQWESRFEDPLSDAESFRLDNDGFITEIGKRAESVKQIQGQYMGLLKFTPPGWLAIEEILNSLKSNQIDGLQMTHLLQMLIESSSTQVKAVPYFGKWGEFDTQSDLYKFESS